MQAVSPISKWQCDECGGTSYVDRDQFRWCTTCGVGTQILERSHQVPGRGNKTSYAPENKLSFGNNLGNPAVNSPADRKALLKVLGRRGSENLGIRAIRIKTESLRAEETTISQRMKSYGSALSKSAGLQDQHLFANSLGSNLNWIASLLSLRNDGGDSKDLTTATFLLNIQKFFGEEKANALMKELWGRKKDGVLVVPESKTRFLSKAKHIIELEKLLL